MADNARMLVMEGWSSASQACGGIMLECSSVQLSRFYAYGTAAESPLVGMMIGARIEHYEANTVFRGLLEGEDYRNRVAGACVYCCPRCGHRIRFRWRSFYNADGASAFKRKLRRVFDDMTPRLAKDEQGCLDFCCPTCAAPTRIIYAAEDSSGRAYHFDIYAALVGLGKPPK